MVFSQRQNRKDFFNCSGLFSNLLINFLLLRTKESLTLCNFVAGGTTLPTRTAVRFGSLRLFSCLSPGTSGVVRAATFCSFGNDQRHDKCRGRTPAASVPQDLHPPLRECQVSRFRFRIHDSSSDQRLLLRHISFQFDDPHSQRNTA